MCSSDSYGYGDNGESLSLHDVNVHKTRFLGEITRFSALSCFNAMKALGMVQMH